MLNLARNIIKQKSKVLLMASLTRSPTRRSTCSPSRRSTMSPTRRPTRRFTRRPAQFLPRIFLPPDLHLKLAKSWNFILNSQKLFLHFQESLDDVLIGSGFRDASQSQRKFLNQMKMSLRWFYGLASSKEFHWRTHFSWAIAFASFSCFSASALASESKLDHAFEARKVLILV